MSWEPYGLDQRARRIVKDQSEDSLREAYKMREAVAYGLERFWGESMRYRANQNRLEEQYEEYMRRHHSPENPELVKKIEIERKKADYWEVVWNKLVEIIQEDITLPEHANVQVDADELWQLNRDSQEIALAVLIQFCDCLVWWTQRYK